MLRSPLPIQNYGSQRVQSPLFWDNYPVRTAGRAAGLAFPLASVWKVVATALKGVCQQHNMRLGGQLGKRASVNPLPPPQGAIFVAPFFCPPTPPRCTHALASAAYSCRAVPPYASPYACGCSAPPVARPPVTPSQASPAKPEPERCSMSPRQINKAIIARKHKRPRTPLGKAFAPLLAVIAIFILFAQDVLWPTNP